MSWTPPPNADSLPLTYHVHYSSEFTSSTSKSTREQSLDLTGLHPFDVYTVNVEAENSGGRSTAVSTSTKTSVSGECIHAMCTQSMVKHCLNLEIIPFDMLNNYIILEVGQMLWLVGIKITIKFNCVDTVS